MILVHSSQMQEFTLLNISNYVENPIANFCISKYEHKRIYSLDELMPDIQKLKHSKYVLEHNCGMSLLGDQLRLYLASKQDNFLYVDADCYIPDFSEILSHKNCTYYDDFGRINNGTFFYSQHDCDFNNYYLNLYNTVPEKDYQLFNTDFFKKYPYKLDLKNKKSGDMDLIKVKYHHFMISKFYYFKKFYPNIDTIYYIKEPHSLFSVPSVYWRMFEDYKSFIMNTSNGKVWHYNTVNCLIPQDDLIRLFKEQMNYTFQKQLKYVEM